MNQDPEIRLPWHARLGNSIDRMLSIFAPRRASARIAARVRLAAYDAAERSRKTANWTTKRSLGKPDIIDLPEMQILQDRARAEIRNNPHAASIVGSFSRNVVGRGIVATAASPDLTFNSKADDLFHDWSTRAEFVDTERCKTFFEMQNLVLETMVAAGEVFVIWSYQFDTRNPGMGLRLRVMEPEALATQYIRNQENGNEIRGGIEVDADGAAVAYWFYVKPQIYVLNYQPTRIPAERVLHIFKQRRPGETHGMTWFAPILRKLRDLADYDRYQLLAAKIEAAIAIMITREGGVAPDAIPTINPPNGISGKDQANNDYAEIEGGLIFKGMPGDEVQAVKPERPGNGYEPFTTANQRSVAAGIGLSYETVARDFSKGTYSSLRQSLLEDRREYRMIAALVITKFCNPVRRLFNFYAVLEGALRTGKAGAYLATRTAYDYTKWHTEGWEWIDPAAEVKAYSMAIDYRFTTREKVAAQTGDDWRENFKQISIEQDQADADGIALPENDTPHEITPFGSPAVSPQTSSPISPGEDK